MTYAIGAAPIGRPGCPDFAFWTASMVRVLIVLIQRRSRVEFIEEIYKN
jgi:hypothetical protein